VSRFTELETNVTEAGLGKPLCSATCIRKETDDKCSLCRQPAGPGGKKLEGMRLGVGNGSPPFPRLAHPVPPCSTLLEAQEPSLPVWAPTGQLSTYRTPGAGTYPLPIRAMPSGSTAICAVCQTPCWSHPNGFQQHVTVQLCDCQKTQQVPPIATSLQTSTICTTSL
jgi:hypothetical protein